MFAQVCKRVLTSAFAVLTVFVLMLFVTSCEEGPGHAPGQSDVEIANFEYGFIEEENYSDRETTISDTNNKAELKVDTVYYCMIEFDVVSRKMNDGLSLLNVLIKFENLNVTNGTTEEAGTGNATEIIFQDANTGIPSKTSTLAYKIPSDPDYSKKIRILIRLLPITEGGSAISIAFEPTGDFDVLGDDGLTRHLSVVKARLDAPVISVDRDNLRLTWKHVEHADYYLIHYSDKTIRYDANIDPNMPAGADLSFHLSEFSSQGVEFGDIKVQACSNNPNYDNSQYSNIEVDVQL